MSKQLAILVVFAGLIAVIQGERFAVMVQYTTSACDVPGLYDITAARSDVCVTPGNTRWRCNSTTFEFLNCDGSQSAAPELIGQCIGNSNAKRRDVADTMVDSLSNNYFQYYCIEAPQIADVTNTFSALVPRPMVQTIYYNSTTSCDSTPDSLNALTATRGCFGNNYYEDCNATHINRYFCDDTSCTINCTLGSSTPANEVCTLAGMWSTTKSCNIIPVLPAPADAPVAVPASAPVAAPVAVNTQVPVGEARSPSSATQIAFSGLAVLLLAAAVAIAV